MTRPSANRRRPARQQKPVRLSDQVLSMFGGMSESWCQLVHNEGNVGGMTIVAGEDTLPLILRSSGTKLDFFRRGLILGRGLPEGSVKVVLSADTIGKLTVSKLLDVSVIADVFPAIDLRITPPEMRFPRSFSLFDQPPSGEPPAAFAQSNGKLQRFTSDQMTPYQEAADVALAHALPHERSLSYVTDIAVGAMLQKPVIE